MLQTMMLPPILSNKVHHAPSIFTAENLLREARRQKSLPQGNVPAICILDPDGDIAHHLVSTEQAVIHPYWACYHTKLYTFARDGIVFGIIPHVVGASFAVLVAEELFVSGCKLLVSMTSARGSAFTAGHDLLPGAQEERDLVRDAVGAADQLRSEVRHEETGNHVPSPFTASEKPMTRLR
jgi:hypothetical protein